MVPNTSRCSPTEKVRIWARLLSGRVDGLALEIRPVHTWPTNARRTWCFALEYRTKQLRGGCWAASLWMEKRTLHKLIGRMHNDVRTRDKIFTALRWHMQSSQEEREWRGYPVGRFYWTVQVGIPTDSGGVRRRAQDWNSPKKNVAEEKQRSAPDLGAGPQLWTGIRNE